MSYCQVEPTKFNGGFVVAATSLGHIRGRVIVPPDFFISEPAKQA